MATARGKRRSEVVNGLRQSLLMYSYGVFQKTIPDDMWGLCWQGTEKGRGSDFGWRVSLAIRALQLAGINIYEACTVVAAMPSVRKHLPKTKVELAEKVRSTVNNYRKTWGQRIDLENDLKLMLDQYRWMHREKMGEVYQQEARRDLTSRIECADQCCGKNDWIRVEARFAAAKLAHEWGKYGEAKRCYRSASDEIAGMQLPEEWKNMYVPWLRQQIELCERQEPTDDASRPIMYEDKLLTLADAVQRLQT